jgi:glycosyltransferase involved in cell wall biosynthesis
MAPALLPSVQLTAAGIGGSFETRQVMNGVSFIVTVFNKRQFLPRVVAALARQSGSYAREFVFVDDGSTDGSAELIAELTRGWRDPVIILQQSNRGASAATNAGAARASHGWLKLVDGDDLLVPGATERLIEAATATGNDLAWGDLGRYAIDDADPLGRAFPTPPFAAETDGLARFIRNCAANSSSILMSAQRYRAAGGCDERLISPDQALFLRLFAVGGGAHVEGTVALIPDQAPGRLSAQERRSRYESVLALYYLVTETPRLSAPHARAAYRRALSRAYRFQRAHGGARLLTGHLWRLIASRLGSRVDAAAMYQALGAFTEDGSTERPSAWLPGALRQQA